MFSRTCFHSIWQTCNQPLNSNDFLYRMFCQETCYTKRKLPWHRKIPCERDDSQDRLQIVGGYSRTGYCNTLSLERMVSKVRQITAMNYTRNHHTNLEQFQRCFTYKIVSCWALKVFCAQDHVALKKFYLLIQGPFDKIHGQLGKIQGLFKDLSNFFNFQGLFKACTNHE